MNRKQITLMLGFTLALSVTAVASAASSISADMVEYDFRNGQAVASGNVLITNEDGKATSKEAE